MGIAWGAVSVSLSDREKQLVILVAQGLRNREIADHLQVSLGTIKEYVTKVMAKLGIRNRVELAVWALTHEDAIRCCPPK